MKKFFSGFLIGALLFGTLGVFAASYTAVSPTFKVYVEGKELNANPPAVVINGYTYLPLRATGDALGVKVNYDQARKRVDIGETSVSSGYSRTNPAPIGIAQKIKVDNYDCTYNATIKVEETVRGEKALQMVKEANKFNSEPEIGKEYVVAKIYVSIDSVSEDKAIRVSDYDFKCYSKNNVKYDELILVNPKPALSTDLYVGGNTTGYAVFQVEIGDMPKIVYGAGYDGSGGIWFKLD